MRHVVHVVGARPNYMKVAPLMDALRDVVGLRQVLVNTGQHYDEAMSGVFLKELGLPVPDRNLDVGSGSHAVQTAKVMIAFENVCVEEKPDLVVVVGDVNSTLAAAVVTSKLHIPVAHVEAGLRSFDRTMPEEINRILTDQVSDLLLTSSRDAGDNLMREGIQASRIRFVGNIMIDSLLRHLPLAQFERIRERVPVREGEYAVLTLHRPSNVDDRFAFLSILRALGEIGRAMPIVFPVHPRTRARIEELGLQQWLEHVTMTAPMGYLDFLSLVAHARLVLTDSGGLQEETTVLRIPCLTLRNNTERPVTISHGTNRLVGGDTDAILAGFAEALAARPDGRVPDLWDGQTAQRIAHEMRALLSI